MSDHRPLDRGGLAHLLVVYLAWGSTYLGIRLAVSGEGGFPPFAMAGLRVFAAAAVLLGWARLRQPDGRILGASVLVTLLTGSFLMARAHDYVVPYAQVHARIMASGAEVVLVDPRGGRYVTDVVRGRGGDPLAGPVVMSLGWLTPEALDHLCARHDVAVLDISGFGPLGVGIVPWGNRWIAGLREHMAAQGCGRSIGPR